MKPLAAHEIFGNWATLLLPINEDDSIDFARLDYELDAIVAAGVNGVYSNGTAGEFYAQSEDEFDRVSGLIAHKADHAKLPFQIGIAHTSAQAALERLRRAKPLAPSAFQVILPDWFPLTDDEAVAFLDRMAEAADPIGLILYNPPHAKRVLDRLSFRRICERVRGVIGAKVGDVDAAWFEAIGPLREQLSIFTPGHLLAKHLPLGSRGAYSNVACISPGGAQKWYERLTTDCEKGADIGRRLNEVFAAHVTPLITRDRYPNAAVDKLLATVGGWADIGARLRWPYRWIDAPELVTRFRDVLRRGVPELFDDSTESDSSAEDPTCVLAHSSPSASRSAR